MERVHYRERQVLRSADLAAEQTYRIAMRRRHNIGGHGWGIVFGLELESADGDVLVEPGMAVDGYGREVIVAAPVRLPATGFGPPAPEALEVWLLYGRGAASSAQRGRWACGPGQEGRWLEEARIRLRPAVLAESETGAESDDEAERRMSTEVADADLAFGPQDVPPDDPDREWPIFLGIIAASGANRAGRPYATLTGATVLHPTGAARLQLGAERAGDRRRFALAMADGPGGFRDRIVIDAARNTIIDGGLELLRIPTDGAGAAEGRLTIGGSPLGATPPPTSGLELNPPIAPPTQALPWRIYRAAGTTPDGRMDELRIEIAHPGEKGDPSGYHFAVGRLADSAFDACLSVQADGTVHVHGKLEVDGQLIQGPIRPDPDDPRFGQALVDGWELGGAATGSAPQVLVQWTPPAVPGADATYTATLSNPGTKALSIMAVLETVSIGKDAQPTGEVPDVEVPLLLAAQGSASIKGTFSLPSGAEPGEELAIMIVAVARDASGRVWYGHGTASVPIDADDD